MNGRPDRFTVVDFLVSPSTYCAQYETLDEILIPAVIRLGGDKSPVLLTNVCMDMRVRAYFQTNGMWDFSDFEIYFMGHWETWDYIPSDQAIRLRSAEESKEVVERVNAKRKASSQASVQTSAKQARPTPTKVVLLTNLVAAGDVDEDLQEETADEAKKYGTLKRCTIRTEGSTRRSSSANFS